MAAWKSWFIGLGTGLCAAWASYWGDAPKILHYAVYAAGPLMILEAITAEWMQAIYRDRQAHPSDDDEPVTVYPQDTWIRAGRRQMMIFALAILAAVVDCISGMGYSAMLWVMLWGVTGHARAALRHLETIARMNHMELPIFPSERIGALRDLAPSSGKPQEHDDAGA